MLGLPARGAAVQAVLLAALPADTRVQEQTRVCSVLRTMPFPFAVRCGNAVGPSAPDIHAVLGESHAGR